MGIFRKSVLIGTAGLAPIKANSKKERTAKATEKQLKIQRQMLQEQRRATPSPVALTAAPTRHEVAPGEQRIVVASAGDKKIQVIKVVRDATGWGLKEAKAFVDRAPSSLILPTAQVEDLAVALRRAGATIKVEGAAESGDDGTDATMAGDLERLASLHDRGVLTDDEFAAAKARTITASDGAHS